MKGYCNNEVLAREGIDTGRALPIKTMALQCNNEVLAREGIDTIEAFIDISLDFLSNNEVLAREGIDTIFERFASSEIFLVTMRY